MKPHSSMTNAEKFHQAERKGRDSANLDKSRITRQKQARALQERGSGSPAPHPQASAAEKERRRVGPPSPCQLPVERRLTPLTPKKPWTQGGGGSFITDETMPSMVQHSSYDTSFPTLNQSISQLSKDEQIHRFNRSESQRMSGNQRQTPRMAKLVNLVSGECPSTPIGSSQQSSMPLITSTPMAGSNSSVSALSNDNSLSRFDIQSDVSNNSPDTQDTKNLNEADHEVLAADSQPNISQNAQPPEEEPEIEAIPETQVDTQVQLFSQSQSQGPTGKSTNARSDFLPEYVVINDTPASDASKAEKSNSRQHTPPNHEGGSPEDGERRLPGGRSNQTSENLSHNSSPLKSQVVNPEGTPTKESSSIKEPSPKKSPLPSPRRPLLEEDEMQPTGEQSHQTSENNSRPPSRPPTPAHTTKEQAKVVPYHLTAGHACDFVDIQREQAEKAHYIGMGWLYDHLETAEYPSEVFTSEIMFKPRTTLKTTKDLVYGAHSETGRRWANDIKQIIPASLQSARNNITQLDIYLARHYMLLYWIYLITNLSPEDRSPEPEDLNRRHDEFETSQQNALFSLCALIKSWSLWYKKESARDPQMKERGFLRSLEEIMRNDPDHEPAYHFILDLDSISPPPKPSTPEKVRQHNQQAAENGEVPVTLGPNMPPTNHNANEEIPVQPPTPPAGPIPAESTSSQQEKPARIKPQPKGGLFGKNNGVGSKSKRTTTAKPNPLSNSRQTEGVRERRSEGGRSNQKPTDPSQNTTRGPNHESPSAQPRANNVSNEGPTRQAAARERNQGRTANATAGETSRNQESQNSSSDTSNANSRGTRRNTDSGENSTRRNPKNKARHKFAGFWGPVGLSTNAVREWLHGHNIPASVYKCKARGGRRARITPNSKETEDKLRLPIPKPKGEGEITLEQIRDNSQPKTFKKYRTSPISNKISATTLLNKFKSLEVPIKCIDKESRTSNSKWVAVVTVYGDTAPPDRITIFGGGRISITPHIDVYQCQNCQRFGHSAVVCDAIPCCSKCSGPHSSQQCAVQGHENYTCVFCSEKGHGARSLSCKQAQDSRRDVAIRIRYQLPLVTVESSEAPPESSQETTSEQQPAQPAPVSQEQQHRQPRNQQTGSSAAPEPRPLRNPSEEVDQALADLRSARIANEESNRTISLIRSRCNNLETRNQELTRSQQQLQQLCNERGEITARLREDVGKLIKDREYLWQAIANLQQASPAATNAAPPAAAATPSIATAAPQAPIISNAPQQMTAHPVATATAPTVVPQTSIAANAPQAPQQMTAQPVTMVYTSAPPMASVTPSTYTTMHQLQNTMPTTAMYQAPQQPFMPAPMHAHTWANSNLAPRPLQ